MPSVASSCLPLKQGKVCRRRNHNTLTRAALFGLSMSGYDRSPRRASPDNRDLGRGRSRSPIVDRRDQGAFERPRVESANTGSNLFVSGLSMDAREEDLGAVFSKYGKITKCEVMFDPRSKGSRGFGFVNFENIADADDALALNGVDLLGRPLNVQKTVPESFVQVEAGMMNVTRIVAGADMMTVTEVAMMTEIETETETETEIEIAILGEVVVVTGTMAGMGTGMMTVEGVGEHAHIFCETFYFSDFSKRASQKNYTLNI
ncbi:hypothetical protein BASA62_010312 [Batrachochytrium salamandrivorans]|nr:hypothetical protein BASA62_010312 [Batrachochytrium salamandrivorans]